MENFPKFEQLARMPRKLRIPQYGRRKAISKELAWKRIIMFLKTEITIALQAEQNNNNVRFDDLRADHRLRMYNMMLVRDIAFSDHQLADYHNLLPSINSNSESAAD